MLARSHAYSCSYIHNRRVCKSTSCKAINTPHSYGLQCDFSVYWRVVTQRYTIITHKFSVFFCCYLKSLSFICLFVWTSHYDWFCRQMYFLFRSYLRMWMLFTTFFYCWYLNWFDDQLKSVVSLFFATLLRYCSAKSVCLHQIQYDLTFKNRKVSGAVDWKLFAQSKLFMREFVMQMSGVSSHLKREGAGEKVL